MTPALNPLVPSWTQRVQGVVCQLPHTLFTEKDTETYKREMSHSTYIIKEHQSKAFNWLERKIVIIIK